ncbi:tetratricopeptide repeat protein [Abyssicoccus albus]|uniref:tetratricopeptide repeat protein n=1 Tax=Abyssicoccus albus TaxID=1817405 RepID=UPI00097E1D90|nr:tetratricopeptide repeat protein [Abyssicoccus albus]AQL56156.1 hypothetical protein BVH56_04095 [Abyssicoccus albus]
MENKIDTLIDKLFLGEIDYVKTQIETIDTINEEELDQLVVLCDQLINAGLILEAQVILNKAIELFPNELDLTAMLVDTHIVDGKFDEAIHILNDYEPSPESLLIEADLYQQMNMPEVSFDKVEKAMELAPKEPVIHFAKAELLYSEGLFNEANRYYEQLININMDYINDVNVNERIADCEYMVGDFESSFKYFNKIDNDDLDQSLLIKKAVVFNKLELKEEAIQILESILNDYPEQTQASELLFDIYENEHDDQEAIKVGYEHIKYNDYNVEMKYKVSRLLLNQKNSEGIKLLKDALAIEPDYLKAQELLVEYLYDHEEYEELLSYFNVSNLIQNGQFIDTNDDNQLISNEVYWIFAKAAQLLEKDQIAQPIFEYLISVLNDNESFLEDYIDYMREIAQTDNVQKAKNMLSKLNPNHPFIVNDEDDFNV